MSPTIHLQLLLITFAGWVGQQQTSIIQYRRRSEPAGMGRAPSRQRVYLYHLDTGEFSETKRIVLLK